MISYFYKKFKFLTNEFLWFIVCGVLNTLCIYITYLFLLSLTTYQVAYFIAYLIGIVFSYVANSKLTFKEGFHIKKFLQFFLLYIVQYFYAAFLLWLFVAIIKMNEVIAPIIIIGLSVPVSFFFSRKVIKNQ